MSRRFQTKVCLTLAAMGMALAVGVSPPALASSQTVTVERHGLVALPVDATSPDPWKSGRLTAIATRMPDGRIRVGLNVRIVATRAFTAQLAIQPCNATYNTADLSANAADPVGHPLLPIPTFSGYSPFKSVNLHKGLNENLRLAAVVSSDDQWMLVPHHWTDCAWGNLYDERETDKAALKKNPDIVDRERDVAFAIKPLILSVTQSDNLGQHR